MSLHDNTVSWYVNWLKEARPDWTDEQRLEVATGFADHQQQPLPAMVKEDEPEPDVPNERAASRHKERLNKFISGLLKEAGEL